MIDRDDFESDEDYQRAWKRILEEEKAEEDRQRKIAVLYAHLEKGAPKTEIDQFIGGFGAGTAFDYVIHELATLRAAVARLEKK